MYQLSWGQESKISYSCLAHAHNDYQQKLPLEAALELGFDIIEIDIVLNGNQIVVSHDDKDLANKPKLDAMYLEPLSKKYHKLDSLWLLIDIKYFSNQILATLDASLQKYDQILDTRYSSHSKIKIVLSGDLPRQSILENDRFKYFHLDGRYEDIGQNRDSHLMPMLSMDITDIVKWNGKSKPGPEDIETLATLVKKVHLENKKLRFWKTKDNAISWMTLLGLGVDIIGVDDKARFYQTMHKLGLIRSKH